MSKKKVYPSKTTLNLCIKEKSPIDLRKLIPLLLVVLILAVLFAKFAVIDRLQNTSRLENELAGLRAKRSTLQAETADYENVASEYSRYSVGWMSEDERILVKRTDMLNLIEDMLMSGSEVREITANGNMVSVTLAGVTLRDTSRFVEALYARDDVESVAVYSASTNNDSTAKTAVSMLISMKHAEGGDGK